MCSQSILMPQPQHRATTNITRSGPSASMVPVTPSTVSSRQHPQQVEQVPAVVASTLTTTHSAPINNTANSLLSRLRLSNYQRQSQAPEPQARTSTQTLQQLRSYFMQNYAAQNNNNIDADSMTTDTEDDDQYNIEHHMSSRFNDRSSGAQNIPSRESGNPQFRNKVVCRLHCRYCTKVLCERGMKAILLADTKVELYSTDMPPCKAVATINQDYCTENCRCRIHDIACLGCGNVVGYHVTQPCQTCLDSCNNGHMWMFSTENITATDRLDQFTQKVIHWAFLPPSYLDKAVNGQPYLNVGH